jgi:DNA repair exonuclease SbcCD ATPase subunit
MAAKKPMKEMTSLREGIRKLAADAQKQQYAGVASKVSKNQSDIRTIQQEFSSFLNEIKKNRESIGKMRADMERMRGQLKQVDVKGMGDRLLKKVAALTESELSEFRTGLAAMRELKSRIEEMWKIGDKLKQTDIALLTRDIETLKTRVKWLESRPEAGPVPMPRMPDLSPLQNRLDQLDARLRRLEEISSELSSTRARAPIVIE